PEQFHRLIAPGNVAQIARHQAIALEGGAVALQAQFPVRAAIDEIKGDARQLAARHAAHVFQIDGGLNVHGAGSSESGDAVTLSELLRAATGSLGVYFIY